MFVLARSTRRGGVLEMLLDRSGVGRIPEQHRRERRRRERRRRERRHRELWQWQGTLVTVTWHFSIAASFTFSLLYSYILRYT